MILETYTRIFTSPSTLPQTISFYVSLLNGTETLHFKYPETGLELAAVSSAHLSVLIIAGEEEMLAPFRETRLTIKVDKLDAYVGFLGDMGVEMLEGVSRTPVGRKMRVRHLDGMVVEYVEHEDIQRD